MYRDDPLDDEQELRDLVGDDVVDRMVDGDALLAALDVLRVLQGWAADHDAARWLTSPQRRLDGRTPADALVDGDDDLVADAARQWAAAQG